jgi:hypothetical protein
VSGFLRTRLRDAFAADLRALAAARIAIGSLLLLDLLIRARDLRAHYSDAGVLPVGPLRDQWLSGWRWSLHGWSGSTAFEAVLFGLAGLAALGLVFGWRTRWVTVAAWVLTVSLQNRNPLVLTGADSLLRALVLWGCFLPWGNRWSLDARRRQSDATAGAMVTTIGTVAWTFQVLLVHVVAGLLKTGDEWRKSLTAVYYTLHIDQYQLPLGELLLRLPDRALRLATAEVLLAELLVPFLLLGGLVAPRFRDRLRVAAVIVLAALHLGLAATLALGLFPWINTASLLLFLPGGVWSWLERRFAGRGASPERATEAIATSTWARAFTRWQTGLGTALLGLVVWWNLATLPVAANLPKPQPARAVVEVLRLDQRWNLFAPRPMTDDGWYVVPGALENGDLVDVYRGGIPVRLGELDARSKPADVSAELGGYRRRKYLQNLRLSRYRRHRALYADYLCREWNRSHEGGERVAALQLVYVRERTPPPGGVAEVEPVALGHFPCAPPGG